MVPVADISLLAWSGHDQEGEVAFGLVGIGVMVIDHPHEGASAQAAFEGVPEGLCALIEQQAIRLTEPSQHGLAHVRLHIDADGDGLGHRKDAPVHADAKERSLR